MNKEAVAKLRTRRFWILLSRIFDFFKGGNIRMLILPLLKKPKIGQNNPKNRQNLSFATASKDHFEGKTALEHLKEARLKGKLAGGEPHGIEVSGFLSAFLDSAKEVAFILFILSLFFQTTSLIPFILISCALIIWKSGRCALLGWSRLERMHKLIAEERWEIEHNRAQEKEELTALYSAKGLEEPLLSKVITHLSSDDNRLLEVMVEEELGLSLENYEHPLKQALGAFLGSLLSASLLLLSLLFKSPYASLIVTSLILLTTSIVGAKLLKNRIIDSTIWQLSIFLLALFLSWILHLGFSAK